MKPAVFSTPMVEAILADRKRHTRRLNGLEEINENPDDWRLAPALCDFDGRYDNAGYAHFEHKVQGWGRGAKAPYQPGDVLWVREKLVKGVDDLAQYADGSIVICPDVICPDGEPALWPWKRKFLPSIFMPKFAARIFLEVLKVRVERLQDIKERDIEAEGVELANPYEPDYAMNTNEIFVKLWNSLHGNGAWDLNPWVFIYEFRRKKCTC